MSCVIYNHSCYTLNSARGVSKVQALLYDNNDVTKNKAALAFLLDPLDPALSETISEKLEKSNSFHVVWLELTNESQVQTAESIESIKREIKDHKPRGIIHDKTWRKWLFPFVLELWSVGSSKSQAI